MRLFHGTSWEKAEALVAGGTYVPGHADNPWSAMGDAADAGVLYCSNVYEYAAQYGDIVVRIEVDEAQVDFIQDCPLSEGDHDWRPEFEGACEYGIPAGVKFQARLC